MESLRNAEILKRDVLTRLEATESVAGKPAPDSDGDFKKLYTGFFDVVSPVGTNELFVDPDPVRWMETYFRIPETPDHLLQLGEYQKACLRQALMRDENGLFKYSLILWSDCKKSIKSTVAAAVALWMAWNTPWGSIKVIANDLKQADSRVAFYIRRCIELNRQMHDLCIVKPSGYTIKFPNNAMIEAIPVDPQGEAGGNDDMVIYSELWGAASKAIMKLWTETTLSPTKFGKSFRWIETYAGYVGEAPILEQLYETAVTNGIDFPWVNDFDPPIEASEAPESRIFALWNTVPRLPWQTPEYYCLPLPKKETDLMVLTNQGWKTAESISLLDQLCTRNSSGVIEYQFPERIFRGDYSGGKLLRLKQSKADLVMTPNHRVFGAFANHTRKVKEMLSSPFEYEYREAREAAKAQVGWIPGDGNWQHAPMEDVEIEGEVYKADDFVEFMAWYLSEGYMYYDTWHGRRYASVVGISQDRDKNQDKYLRILGLVERMGLKPVKDKSGIRICNARLARYVAKFGKSHEKYIPRFILDGCSREQLKIFLSAYLAGDGTKKKQGRDAWMVYTNSDQMALDLMEIAFKVGYRPTRLGSYSSAPEKGRKPIHHISINTSHIGWYASGKKRNNWSEFEADAGTEVWCPTLPNGNFYVMQNGVCYWTGNSQEEAVLSPIEFSRVHRNQWVTSENVFVPIEWWDACKDLEQPKMYVDQPVILAVDAAVSNDSFGIVAVTGRDDDAGTLDVRFAEAWKPPKHGKIDFTKPEAALRLLIQEWNVVEVCYDEYQLADMANKFTKDMLAHMHPFNQQKPRLIADKQLQDMIRERRVKHNGSLLLRDHIFNANGRTEGEDKLRIVKRSHALKIDLAVCLSMASARARYWRL
jgi:phage terminase large subunit-like protein